MRTISFLWRIVVRPRATASELLEVPGIHISLGVVVGFAIVLAAGSLISHLTGGYPPPPEDLRTWTEAWGEFTMLPFLKVPAEGYRLVQAIFMVPLVLAIWVLMAGSARVLSALFGGKVSFDQYANLFGFSFFAFWIIAAALDTLLSGVLGGFVLAALRLEYGSFVKSVITAFYPIMYTILFGLGGVYNAIVTHQAERFSLWRSALIGIVTFLWPNSLSTLLLR